MIPAFQAFQAFQSQTESKGHNRTRWWWRIKALRPTILQSTQKGSGSWSVKKNGGISLPLNTCFTQWVSSRYPVVGIVTCLHKTSFGCVSFGLPNPLWSTHPIGWRMVWSVRSSVDGNSLDPTPTNGTDGRTRLVRVIQGIQIKLSTRILELRKDLSMKILFFLVGFYCATAFATVIGQTGDWDILSAALAVFVVELIGALMYRASIHLFDKVRRLITMFNYWKAGLCLGLFLDSFKYEMNNIIGSCNPFNFEIDDFPIFL
ncbi:Ycf20-like protein [Vitis vinifera]|uniref:Ycf20-like protein n=1 Tax=Vitis vinifera TaxID=29760 RepID=A0A438GXK2_VITVI|nr:Ycf20-like protein [Vitis vinifera]